MPKPTFREWVMIALLGPIILMALVGITAAIWQAVAEGGWGAFALIVWSAIMVVGFLYLFATQET